MFEAVFIVFCRTETAIKLVTDNAFLMYRIYVVHITFVIVFLLLFLWPVKYKVMKLTVNLNPAVYNSCASRIS